MEKECTPLTDHVQRVRSLNTAGKTVFERYVCATWLDRFEWARAQNHAG